MPDFLTFDDVAKQIHCSKNKVRDFANERQIAITLIGRKQFFTQQAVDDFVAGHTLPPVIDYNWLVKSYGREAVDKFIKEHTLEAKS